MRLIYLLTIILIRQHNHFEVTLTKPWSINVIAGSLTADANMWMAYVLLCPASHRYSVSELILGTLDLESKLILTGSYFDKSLTGGL